MRVLVLLVVVACGGPDGRVHDPFPPPVFPDLSTGSSTSGDHGQMLIDLPAEVSGGSSSGVAGSTSEALAFTTGDAVSTSSASSSGSGSSSSSAGDSTSSPGSTGEESTGSSSTGEAPSGCPCEPGIDNFCDFPPKTPGCDATFPGGYCDPDGDGAYFDADFNAGFFDWKAKCG